MPMFNRRSFLKWLGVAAGILIARPVSLVRAKTLALGLDKVEKLKEVGGSVILKIKERPILFIRDSEATVRAVDPTCTHKACQVAYKNKGNKIECPCHGSTFDLEGKVLSGPAEKPLRTYGAKLEEGRILLSLD